MSWLVDLFRTGSVAGSVFVIALAASLGLALGNLRVRGVGLGIAGVLFSGLLFGHWHAHVSPAILEFATDFGLILFVYCVGVQVGPGFAASLRSAGLALNLLAAGIVFSGAALAVLVSRFAHIGLPTAVGLLSGAVTNTPSLGAAQTAFRELPGHAGRVGALPGLGYAVAYPFGVLGLIGAMVLARPVCRERAGLAAPPDDELEDAQRGIESAVPAGEEQSPVQVLPAFIGLALGVILGQIPLPIGGLPAPLSLGLAAGPMIVAIALSSFPRLGPLTWRMPQRANLFLREIAIVLFLACVGLGAGGGLANTLLHGDGFRWMAYGALITFLPVALAALVAHFALRLRYFSICGLLAGSMTDPPALAFASSLTSTRAPMEAYATVYPLTQLLRVLTAQLIVLVFMR